MWKEIGVIVIFLMETFYAYIFWSDLTSMLSRWPVSWSTVVLVPVDVTAAVCFLTASLKDVLQPWLEIILLQS